MSFLTGAYVGLLTALSANQVPTEQSGTGYARVAVSASFDPIANIAELLNGFTFENTGGGAWTASTALAVFDASSGGNLLFSIPIPSNAVAAGASLSYAALETFGPLPFPNGGSCAAGASLGLMAGASVTAGVGLTMTAAGALAATSPASPVLALTFAATLASDGSKSQAFSNTMTGNMTLSNPTNAIAGQSYRWFLKQDGTGSRLLTLGSAFKTVGGAPTLSTAANTVDRYTAYYDGTTFWGILEKALA
jgi:hypothetical protein